MLKENTGLRAVFWSRFQQAGDLKLWQQWEDSQLVSLWLGIGTSHSKNYAFVPGSMAVEPPPRLKSSGTKLRGIFLKPGSQKWRRPHGFEGIWARWSHWTIKARGHLKLIAYYLWTYFSPTNKESLSKPFKLWAAMRSNRYPKRTKGLRPFHYCHAARPTARHTEDSETQMLT